jgi:hypothetical protein
VGIANGGTTTHLSVDVGVAISGVAPVVGFVTSGVTPNMIAPSKLELANIEKTTTRLSVDVGVAISGAVLVVGLAANGDTHSTTAKRTTNQTATGTQTGARTMEGNRPHNQRPTHDNHNSDNSNRRKHTGQNHHSSDTNSHRKHNGQNHHNSDTNSHRKHNGLNHHSSDTNSHRKRHSTTPANMQPRAQHQLFTTHAGFLSQMGHANHKHNTASHQPTRKNHQHHQTHQDNMRHTPCQTPATLAGLPRFTTLPRPCDQNSSTQF